MANDYGIKVVKATKNIDTSDIRDILLSSRYSMLKYHSDTASSFTVTPGDSNKYGEISHNLGYVPAYIAYIKYQGKVYNVNALAASGVGGNLYFYSWADSTKVRVGIVFEGLPYGRVIKPVWPATLSDSDYYDDHWADTGFWVLGKKDGEQRNGAIRFPGIPFAKDAYIQSATLKLAVATRGSGNGSFKLRTWGIDQDNTASFSSGNSPMGRPLTDAVHTHNFSPLNQAGTYLDVGVTNHIREITTRNNWVANNAIGFVMRDNGSDDNVWFEDDLGYTIDSYLEITGGPNLTVEFRVIIFKDKIA